MRTYQISDWAKPNYYYEFQIQDCEKGKIITFIKTAIYTAKDGRKFDSAKDIDRVAISNEALKSIGLTEQNIVYKLRTNGEIRSILKYGESLIRTGEVKTSKLFIYFLINKLKVHFYSARDDREFKLDIPQEKECSTYLDRVARALSCAGEYNPEFSPEEAPILQLRGMIYEDDYSVVGKSTKEETLCEESQNF